MRRTEAQFFGPDPRQLMRGCRPNYRPYGLEEVHLALARELARLAGRAPLAGLLLRGFVAGGDVLLERLQGCFGRRPPRARLLLRRFGHRCPPEPLPTGPAAGGCGSMPPSC